MGHAAAAGVARKGRGQIFAAGGGRAFMSFIFQIGPAAFAEPAIGPRVTPSWFCSFNSRQSCAPVIPPRKSDWYLEMVRPVSAALSLTNSIRKRRAPRLIKRETYSAPVCARALNNVLRQ